MVSIPISSTSFPQKHPVIFSKSSKNTFPSASTVVWLSFLRVGSAFCTACSSSISPTITSNKSSNETSPFVPPCSSITTAICVRLFCISLNKSKARIEGGINKTPGIIISETTIASFLNKAFNKSFACKIPTTLSNVRS